MVSNRSLGKKGETGVHLKLIAFVFLNNGYVWWSPAFMEMAKHLPAAGK